MIQMSQCVKSQCVMSQCVMKSHSSCKSSLQHMCRESMCHSIILYIIDSSFCNNDLHVEWLSQCFMSMCCTCKSLLTCVMSQYVIESFGVNDSTIQMSQCVMSHSTRKSPLHMQVIVCMYHESMCRTHQEQGPKKTLCVLRKKLFHKKSLVCVI